MKILYKRCIALISMFLLSLFLVACEEEMDIGNVNDDQQEETQKEQSKEVENPIEAIKEKRYVLSVELDDDGILNVKTDQRSYLTINFVVSHVVDIFDDMKIAFEDEKIKGFYASVITTLTDSKGDNYEEEAYNIYYSRDDFEKLNYDEFYKTAYSEPYRIFNESTSYIIHPVIYREMKEEYRKNLIHGQSKAEKITEQSEQHEPNEQTTVDKNKSTDMSNQSDNAERQEKEKKPIKGKIKLNEELSFSTFDVVIKYVKTYEKKDKHYVKIKLEWTNKDHDYGYPEKTFYVATQMDVKQNEVSLNEIYNAWDPIEKFRGSGVFNTNPLNSETVVTLEYELQNRIDPIEITFIPNSDQTEEKSVTVEISK